jgi:hypothetical protein
MKRIRFHERSTPHSGFTHRAYCTKLAVASFAGYWTKGQLCAFGKWARGDVDARGCHRLVGHMALNRSLYAAFPFLKL